MNNSKLHFSNSVHANQSQCASRIASVLTVFAIGMLTTSICADVRITKIGNPVFEPSGFTLGTASLDFVPTTADGFFQGVWRWRSDAFGPHHVLADDEDRFVLLPGVPHHGPYDQEVRRAYATHGQIHTNVVLASEVRGANFFQSGFALVPSEQAPLGNSPDGDSVPVIPDDVYPIELDSELERNGVPVGGVTVGDDLFSLSEEGSIRDENGVRRDFVGLGWSHQIVSNSSGNPLDKPTSELVGNWERRQTLLDNSGENGWEIVYRWKVVARSSGAEGDLNHNGELDMHDLNILTQNVAVEATNLKLDLNDNEAVNVDDVHYWVTDLKNTWVGDANLDGEFNSGDFVKVFRSGKYETDELALWSEGDWNSDERFDSGDFVVAFQGGGYEMGAKGPIAAVPEPSGLLPFAIGLLGVLQFRDRSFTGKRRRSAMTNQPVLEALESKTLLTAIDFTQHEISQTDDSMLPAAAATADFDADGDLDVLVVSRLGYQQAPGAGMPSTEIAWFENTDGNGTFDTQRNVVTLEADDSPDSDSPKYRFVSAAALDLNGDGFPDIVAELRGSGEAQIVLFANEGGTGNFVDFVTIGRGRLIASEDLDGDGDVDLLVDRVGGLSWFENTDGFDTVAAAKRITTDQAVLDWISIDVDGDGKFDGLNLRSQNGGTTFDSWRLGAATGYYWPSIYASDIDGDGDLDVVVAGRDQETTHCDLWASGPSCRIGNLEVAWYENTDGRGALGAKRLIGIDTPAASWFSGYSDRIKTHDMDGDGDQDVMVVTSLNNFEDRSAGDAWDKIMWYENLGNAGSFSDAQVIPANTNSIVATTVGDVDNDGDADLVVVSRFDGRVLWLESNEADQEGRLLGDSNGDGVFDSGDLVAVFAAGEYEDEIEDNSTFEEGDWNGDGEFDSSDLVAAFKAGTYVRAAKSFEFASAIDWLFDTSDLKHRPRNWRS